MFAPIDPVPAFSERNSDTAQANPGTPAVNNQSQSAQPDKATLYSDQSRRPVMLAIAWESIPAALRFRQQWVGWVLKWRKDTWSKVLVKATPYEGGWRNGKSNDPETWASFKQARAMWDAKQKTWYTLAKGVVTLPDPDGPGFVFKAGGGLVGIDLDKCRNPVTSQLSPLAQRITAELPGYWEVSPSGTGIKGIFFGSLPDGWKGKKNDDLPDGQGCEIYDRGRYFAITGQRIDTAALDLTSCAEQLPAFLSEFFPEKEKRATKRRLDRIASNEPTNETLALLASRGPLSASEKIRRARGYLSAIEGAVSNKGGHNATFRAACKIVVDFDLSLNDAFPLLSEWNQTCSPPWDVDLLWRKLTEADKETGPRGLKLLEDREQESFGPIGYDNLTAEEIELLTATKPTPTCSTPAAAPEPCPFQASRDMRDELNLSTPKCRHQSPVRFEKKAIRFVCFRDCGNGTDCRPCLDKRLHKLLKMSDSYLIRTSVLIDPTSTDKPRVVYAAIKNSGPTGALNKSIIRRNGERVSILTDDAEAVAEILAGDGDVSRFLLEGKKEAIGEIGTSAEEQSLQTSSQPTAQPLPTHLWVISLPAHTEPPEGFHKITVAAAIAALHNAVKTVPKAPEGTTRYKPTHKSAGWGDEEEKTPTDTRCLGPSAFKPAEVRDILNATHVPVVAVQFDGKRTRTLGVGWSLPDVQAAAMNVWIGGTAAPFRPTVERVTELAKHWLPKLAALPREIGQGKRVSQVLRENLWHISLYDIDQQVKDADEEDKAEAEWNAEAASILRSLREQYRGRESEAKGLVAFLLAC